jgi:phosphoglycerate dehydrogenase-like enzyme
MKVVIAAFLTDDYLGELRTAFPDVEFVEAATDEAQLAGVGDADAFFGWPSPEVFRAAERLRWLHNPGTGIDRMTEIPDLVNSDVVLTNARGPHAAPMADHVFSMILTFAHRSRELWEDQRVRQWDMGKYDGEMVELGGSTMGILALGDVGSAVARRAHGFGMNVIAVDKRPVECPPEVSEVWGLERLDELLGISDWFVVTAPLTEDSRGMIDRRRIGLLKPGAHIVVISRGGILDEDALVDALRSGTVAGAGLDVMAVEPLPPDNALWGLDNVILAPHVSALTPEMWEGRRKIFKENLRRFLANEPFLYVCDKTAGF